MLLGKATIPTRFVWSHPNPQSLSMIEIILYPPSAPAIDTALIPSKLPFSLHRQPHHPPPKILVVDDQARNREVLVTLLQTWGFRVQEATDGEVAIAQWQQWQPDLIFMDIRMPKLAGDAAVRCIKQQDPQTPTRIVAVTANAFETDRAALLALGCDGFIRKPFQHQDIVNCLMQQLPLQLHPVNPDQEREEHNSAAGVSLSPDVIPLDHE